MKKAAIKSILNEWGFDFAEHSPGDGVTRYKVGSEMEMSGGYFAARDHRTVVALGKKELECIARGILLTKGAE